MAGQPSVEAERTVAAEQAPTGQHRQVEPGELSQDWSDWFGDVVTMPLYRWRTYLILIVSLVVLLWLGFQAVQQLDGTSGAEPLPTTTTALEQQTPAEQP